MICFSSPCVVDDSANIKVAGKRIAWGKYVNCGQTCLVPDYILCNQSIRDELVTSIKAAVKQFYGDVSTVAFLSLLLYTCMKWLRTLKSQRIIVGWLMHVILSKSRNIACTCVYIVCCLWVCMCVCTCAWCLNYCMHCYTIQLYLYVYWVCLCCCVDKHKSYNMLQKFCNCSE